MQREGGFAVKVSMADCPASVLVNGIPVLVNDDAHRIDTTIAVTEFMVPGVNALSWEMLLEHGRLPADARAKVTLAGGPATSHERHDLFSVVHAGAVPGEHLAPPETSIIGPVSAGTIAINPRTDIALLSRQINIAMTMPQWAWITSPVIPNTPATLASITHWYQQLVALLTSHQRNALIGLHAEKIRELSVAYGLSEPETVAMVELPGMGDDPEWQLVPPDWSGLFVDTAAGGRLVRLLSPATGPVIAYRNRAGLHQSFNIWLRHGGSDWVLSR